ncbi:MAG: protein translocase subunit SecF [Chloroflexi bacterium]|nr:protein translocase subunit SecF [Chloroflexota bacterium]
MDIVGKRRWFLLFSLVLLLPGIISLAITPRLYLGIEFTGGSTINVQFSSPVNEATLRSKLLEVGHSEAIIQAAGSTGYFIRLRALEAAEGEGAVSERQRINDALNTLAPVTAYEVSTVSGVIARDTVSNSYVAVAVALVAILLYISWSFRRVPKPVRYGTVAVVALLFDVLVVMGAFSILGKLIKMEVNALFIPAILTVIGYAVNDTIVVMDRIRENAGRSPEMPLPQVVNNSIMETLGRSLLTGMTTLVAILALLFIGGESLRPFLVALLMGIAVGTYASIGVASLLLVAWERGELDRLFFWKRSASRSSAQAARAGGG